jgi:hypothetical protein
MNKKSSCQIFFMYSNGLYCPQQMYTPFFEDASHFYLRYHLCTYWNVKYPKPLTPPNLGDIEQQEFSFIAGRNEKRVHSLGKSVSPAVS